MWALNRARGPIVPTLCFVIIRWRLIRTPVWGPVGWDVFRAWAIGGLWVLKRGFIIFDSLTGDGGWQRYLFLTSFCVGLLCPVEGLRCEHKAWGATSKRRKLTGGSQDFFLTDFLEWLVISVQYFFPFMGQQMPTLFFAGKKTQTRVLSWVEGWGRKCYFLLIASRCLRKIMPINNKNYVCCICCAAVQEASF